MTFSDVFKSSFLSNINAFSTLDVLLALGLAFVLGLFIFLIYKKTYQGVMYSDSFGVSLIAMSMITSLVIIAVTSNVVLSLVGGLSYQLSIDSVEKDVILQVTRVTEKL
ncbi:MAG: hypothetical protein UH854_01235, partial [Clostridia bacterium]|nr:hypothetical protein [Clostridia bacterium]